MPRWSVDMIRKRMERLGTVLADTEAEAIKLASKQFQIEPARQSKIVVTKVSERDD
jgi:hypothetical protein